MLDSVQSVPRILTYNCDFATKLVLDLACLDCIWRVLLNELVQVLDTHLDIVMCLKFFS